MRKRRNEQREGSRGGNLDLQSSSVDGSVTKRRKLNSGDGYSVDDQDDAENEVDNFDDGEDDQDYQVPNDFSKTSEKAKSSTKKGGPNGIGMTIQIGKGSAF